MSDPHQVCSGGWGYLSTSLFFVFCFFYSVFLLIFPFGRYKCAPFFFFFRIKRSKAYTIYIWHVRITSLQIISGSCLVGCAVNTKVSYFSLYCTMGVVYALLVAMLCSVFNGANVLCSIWCVISPLALYVLKLGFT